jgi:hypothetical protein
VQLCSLAAGEVSEADALDALVDRLVDRYPATEMQRPPRMITEVVWPARLARMSQYVRSPPANVAHPLLLGLDAQSGEPLWIDPASLGGAMFVAGGRDSGRSNAALVVGSIAMHLGWDVIGVAISQKSPLLDDRCPFDVVTLDKLDARLASATSPRLVVLDDAQSIPTDDVIPVALLGASDFVVVTGTTALFSGTQRPLLALGLRKMTVGVVLVPESHLDLDLVGAKSDGTNAGAAAGRRAGQGLFGFNGDIVEVIVPRFE